MSALSPKLRKTGPNTIAFWCPGCSTAHGVNIGRNGWLWNEDPNSPTFTPSILAQGIYRCHSFVRNGKIEFLSDSTHGLRGMTVDLPNWPFSEEDVVTTSHDTHAAIRRHYLSLPGRTEDNWCGVVVHDVTKSIRSGGTC